MLENKDLKKRASALEAIKMDKRELRDKGLSDKQRVGLILRVIAKLKRIRKKT